MNSTSYMALDTASKPCEDDVQSENNSYADRGLHSNKGEMMKASQRVLVVFICMFLIVGMVSCATEYQSGFVNQAIKPIELAKIKYRTLKSGAIGESTGFKFLWIPFASPSEADAKRDMLDRMQKEGVSTTGKNIAFSNATADRGGFGVIGLIGAPTITLTADVVEILGEAQPGSQQN